MPRLLCSSVLACLVAAGPAIAQETVDPPAHLAVVEGVVMLAHDNDFESAASGIPVIPGDRFETSSGRLEILWPEGTAVDLDEDSTLELGGATLLRLTRGRLAITTARDADGRSPAYTIDTPAGSARVSAAGEYRVAVEPARYASGVEVQLKTLRGSASLTTDRGAVSLRAGQMASVRDDEGPGAPVVFNTATRDAFESWAATTRTARAATPSARYLPSDLRVYSNELEENGTWEYDAPYGYVWYPSVAADWHPYYDGYWTSVPSYGFTWVGRESWSWPTHHYGRWGVAGSRWFWVPDRRWAPAWVSWASAPSYVSWCPLGVDNQPVSALSVATTSMTTGWVVLPSTFLGAPLHVRQYAVDQRRVDGSQFAVQTAAPSVRRGSNRRAAAATRSDPPRAAAPTASTAVTGGAGSPVMTAAPAVPAAGVAGFAQPRYPDPVAPVVVTGAPRERSPADQEWRRHGRGAGVVPATAPAAVPLPPPVPSAPGAVPRWSAPSVPVPQSMAPVPSWSAPSTGVPRWSAPAIAVPAQQVTAPQLAPAIPPPPPLADPNAATAVPRHGGAPTESGQRRAGAVH